MNLKDKLIWAYINKNDILTEKQECIEEGKDISLLEEEFNKYSNEETSQDILEKFLEKTYNLHTNLNEPSDFDNIISLCKGQEDYKNMPANIEKKVTGAWIGRIIGCELGKPFEGSYKENIENYLKEGNNFPLKFYAKYNKEAIEKYHPNSNPIYYLDGLNKAHADDDLNYPTLNLKIYKDCKNNPEPVDFTFGWLNYLPFTSVCTAERVAYKNFTKTIDPPLSASIHNPYREWIGAQIRGDFFGWINPKSPKKAVELAFKDACISHVKNGIYGEMFIASLLSNAFHKDTMENIILKALNFVPTSSRLYKGIQDIINLYHEGKTFNDTVDYIHSIWNEKDIHHWCHTISNAQIVIASLLWSKDFSDGICKAVMTGFDTDCNGATVGSILGLYYGIDEIDSKWYELFNDTLETDIAGYNNVKISDMIKETLDLIKNI